MTGTIPLDTEGRSPFRAAVETKDFGRVEATLAADVVFHSPAVFAPYEGRGAVGGLLHVVGQVLAPELVYVWQMHDGDREVLCFTTRVGDREVQGVDLLRYNADGEVAELTVMMRPLSGLTAVRDAIGALLAARAS